MIRSASDFRKLARGSSMGLQISTGRAADADGERTRLDDGAPVIEGDVFQAVLMATSRDGEPEPSKTYPLVAWWFPDPSDAEDRLDIVATVSESLESVTLRFPDGSTDQYTENRANEAMGLGGVDMGVLLLQPITVDEIRGVERILSELEAAIQRGSLSDFQERRIIAMAEVIREARNDAEPGTSERWTVVGSVRTALRYVYKDVPKDALAWWKLTEILAEINWTALAQSFPL